MSALKAGDSFPEGVSFTYVPFSPDKKDITSCGIGVKYDASKEFKDKKVVLVAVPGAFTPTCQEKHLPGFLGARDKLKAKGVDEIVVLATNDHWVMSAWAKANGVEDESVVFAADDAGFSKSIGWVNGERAGRYAIVVDHGKVIYAEKEPGREVTVSGVDDVLAKI